MQIQIKLLAIFICLSFISQSQENTSIYGSFESNSQYLNDDEGLNFYAPSDNFRSNNYLQLDFQNGNFSYGIQYESYLPSALLGYSEIFDNNEGIAQYYFKYENTNSEITVGSFYEQFGNGLVFRAWEDRQLGINNSLRGIRYRFSPSKEIEISAIHGKQRFGFEYSNSVISGVNSNIDISEIVKLNKFSFTIGVSHLNRYQKLNAGFGEPENVNVSGVSLDLFYKDFYINAELAKKGKDVIANEGEILSERMYDGTALQVDIGYSKKGLGINTSMRRLENFNFYSDKLAEGNIYNQQTLSYVPALTKQQDYLLTNIYVYNSQPRLVINNIEKRVGEIGFQNDIFYSFKKESFLGKYRTKLAINFSYWGAIGAEFMDDESYNVDFVGKGRKYYQDFNIEVKNRWNKRLSSTITFLNLSIDKGITLGGPVGVDGNIDAQVGVFELNVKDGKNRNNRFVLQHLWTKEDRKEWMGFVYEIGINNNVNFFISDLWNYGSSDKLHYYNFGGSYSKGSTRLSANYGRQRGGLICVGGVCRFVPESNGYNLSLSYSF